jgi:hypothetical protein
MDCKGTLRQVFICLRPPLALHTVYILYTYSHREGVEGWTREKIRGPTVYKAGSKIPTYDLNVSPVYKL